MKIRKLHLKNIGVFDDETIEFKECPAKDKAEIHILTGENGTGKTTILQSLARCFRKSSETSFSKRIRNKNQNTSLVIFYLDKGKTQLFSISSFERFPILPKDPKPQPKAIRFGTKQRTENEELENYIDVASINVRENQITDESQFGGFRFAVFAYSGYRKITDEPIEIAKEVNENPLYQALDFLNYENSRFNVNQWLGENLLNSSLAETRDRKDQSKRLKDKIKQFENVLNDIIEDKIKFEMQSANKLILVKDNKELDFDVLPDGLKSLISWIGDLLMRLDSLKWKDDTPIFDREIILFLDEIEVHLHPAWQRKVLPVVQNLFKNAQIFVSTHSPFVVNSVDDAWVYELEVKDGKAKVREKSLTKTTESVQTTLEEVFEVPQLFGLEVQKDLDRFYELRDKLGKNGGKADKEFKEIAKRLLEKSEKQESAELQSIVEFELNQLNYAL